MPIIQLENGDKLQFDDNYTDEQIGEAVDHYMNRQVQSQNDIQLPQPEEGFQEANRRRAGEFARGIPQGLGNVGIGVVQGLTDLGEAGAGKIEKAIYGDNMNAQTFGNRLADQVKQRNAAQGKLPISERAGIFVGETAPFLTVGGGTTSKIASLPFKGSRALGLAAGSGIGGATMGATSMQDQAGLDNRLKETEKNAAIAALTGGTLGLIGSGVSKFVGKPQTARTAEEIRNAATQAYKLADETGGNLTDKFSTKFTKVLDENLPKTELGKKLAGDDPADTIINNIKNQFSKENISSAEMISKPRNTSLKEYEELDQFLTNKIDELTNNGIPTQSSRKLSNVQSKLREMVQNPSAEDIAGGKEGFKTYKEATKLWSSAAKMRDIERIIARSEMTDNPATAIKTGFRTLAMNPARMRGFSPEEQKAITKAAKSGVITDTLRTAGSRLTPIISLATGGGASTLAAQGGSMAARGLANRAQLGRAQDVIDLINNRGAKIPQKIGNKETLKRAMALAAANSNGGVSDAQAAELTMEDARQFIINKYKQEAPWYKPSEQEIERFAKQMLQRKMIK